ncbi:MAG: hypothetical protein LBM66_00945, partial [Bifidobacteriaceae bacterium]|nr:hypothetical protein [Bifidobacteriaceae bacterium]
MIGLTLNSLSSHGGARPRRLIGVAFAAAVALGLTPGAMAVGPDAAPQAAPHRAAAVPAVQGAAEVAAPQAGDKDLIPSKFAVERIATGLNLSLDGGAPAVDSVGNLYVPDQAGHRVDIFDAARFRAAKPGQPLFLAEPDRTFMGLATAQCTVGFESGGRRCFIPGSLAIGPGDALYVMQAAAAAPGNSAAQSIARYPKAVVAAGSGAPDAVFGGPLGKYMGSPFAVAPNGDV